MKIEKKYIWNVERKSKKYWLSFLFLLIPCLFEYSILNGPILYIYQYMNIKTEIFGRNLILLRCLNFIFLIGLIVLCIMSVEVFFSVAKVRQNRDRMSKSLYSFSCYPQFKVDIFILCVTVIAIVFTIYQNMEWLHPDSIVFILFFTISLIGIYINVSCVFPWRNYWKIQNSLKDQEGIFQEAWFCISTHTEISTFSVLPGACENIPVVITENELSLINERRKSLVRGRDFNKLLVYIDNLLVNGEFRSEIEKYSSYLHMRCLVILKNESQYIQYEKEINMLKDRLETQIIYMVNNIYSINNLDEYLGIKYTYNVVKCLKERGGLQNLGKVLDDVYLNIIHGPEVAVKFFRICLIEPNLSKAIYQLFDYIDLQYRLACAFFAPKDLNWYVKRSFDIGNITRMFEFLRGNHKELITKIEIESKYIFDNDWWEVIEKYLPDYSKNFRTSQKMNSEEIKKLSMKLRNKLRAHQDMQLMDVPIMLNLVFRVALATNYFLGINQMVISCGYNDNVTGNYGNIVGKMLSPFLESNQGQYWIFNNAKKENDCFKMEYIDFLSGSIKNL